MEHPGSMVSIAHGMVELHGQGDVVMAPLPVNPAQGIHGNKAVEGLGETQMECLELHPGYHGSRKHILWEIGLPKKPLPVAISLLIGLEGMEEIVILLMVRRPKGRKGMVIPVKYGIRGMDHVVVPQFPLLIKSHAVPLMVVLHGT